MPTLPRATFKTLLYSLAVGFVLTSCDQEEDAQPTYQVPTTYTFDNVNYSGQTTRLAMLDELVEYIGTAKTGAVLDAQKMKNMYANQNSPFASAALNTATTKQLKDKTFLADQNAIEAYFDKIAAASRSTTPGSNGVAGVVASKTDATRKYLFDENGIDCGEFIEKSIMGATFFYQAAAVYLGEEKTGDAVDNKTVTPGEGTPMEHHWDEAFGYLGVPKDYPTNKTGIGFWGEYIDRRDATLGSSAKLMNAFLTGRAAISNKDLKTKNAMIPVIREEWEKVSAASAISYLNRAKSSISDDAVRNHVLTEALGFINALKYSPTKRISQGEIDQVLGFLGTNFYTVTATNIDKAKDVLAAAYGLNSTKDAL